MTIWPKGTPQPKGSVSAFYDKVRHRMQRYDSNRKGKAWAATVQAAALEVLGLAAIPEAPVHPAGQPVHVSVAFYLPRPKKPKHKEYPLGKPDLDKLIRGVLDPLTGILWKDDSQVAQVLASKEWAAPGMEGAIIAVNPIGSVALDQYAEAEGAVGV